MFKEAYEEFKHVLLALIYDKDDQSSPVANEVGFFLSFLLFIYFIYTTNLLTLFHHFVMLFRK